MDRFWRVGKDNITVNVVVGTVSGSVTPVSAGVYQSFTTALGKLLLLFSHHPCLVTRRKPRHTHVKVTVSVTSRPLTFLALLTSNFTSLYTLDICFAVVYIMLFFASMHNLHLPHGTQHYFFQASLASKDCSP